MQPSEDAELRKLVHMANQIAAFFRPYPPEEAATAIRDHVQAFWTPHMRARLQSAPAAAIAALDPLAALGVGREGQGSSAPQPASGTPAKD
jgi:formate dehydrogenase subunit delta